MVIDFYTVPEAEEVTLPLPLSPLPQSIPPNETSDTNDTIWDPTTVEESEVRHKLAALGEKSELKIKTLR